MFFLSEKLEIIINRTFDDQELIKIFEDYVKGRQKMSELGFFL